MFKTKLNINSLPELLSYSSVYSRIPTFAILIIIGIGGQCTHLSI